jgi:arabinogalactan endo-1,4-beta-galactosidase
MIKKTCLVVFLIVIPSLALADTIQRSHIGKTKCYDTAGTEIPCALALQDGNGMTMLGGYGQDTFPLRSSDASNLNDTFTGNRLDLSRWDPFPFGGATISTGEGLRFSLNGTQSYSTVQVFTLYQFAGDFDVQVDFTLGSGWNTPFPAGDASWPHLNGGELAVYLDEPNWMVISRNRSSTGEGFNFYSNVDLGTAPRNKFTPSTAANGSLRIVATGGTYHFLFNQGAGWIELATAPAWSQPVRLFLGAGNVDARVSFSSTLTNFRINSGSSDYQPYQLPGTFLHRPGFMIGGQFVNATLGRYFNNLTSYNPMSQLFARGMSLARGCMTTVSDPNLAATPPSQWYTLGWKNSYWSSLQMMTQLFKDAMAAGMRINACFFLSEGAAGAGVQDAPPAWRNLSVADTAARIEQYMYETTTYLINQGIRVDLYDIGNEILFGILNFLPGDRIPLPAGTDMTRSISYLRTSVWPTQATLLTAAIRGVRRADPQARTVLHIESLLSPGMDTAFAFFQTMHSLGVPYDVAGLSLPYMDATNLSGMTSQEYFQRFESLVNRLSALGKPVYIAENSYPADTDPAFNPPMLDFPYTEAGQAAYVNSQLRWVSNNPHIIGWTWFYPEWFPGITPNAPHVLEIQGLYRDRQTLRTAAAELNVALPATQLYFPHVATSIPWQTEIAIINTGNQTVTGTLMGLSDGGVLRETKPVTLSGRGRTQIIVANEFTNHTDIGYIIFDTASDTVEGYTKFYWEGVYRAAIPAVKEVKNTSEIYISHIASNADWWTGISLVNTTSATKQLTITFNFSNSNNNQSRSITLNANEHRAYDIARDFFNNQPQPEIESAVITNASGVIGLELFGNSGGSNHLDGILLTGNTTSTIYYPHVAGNNEWWTGIVAYNPSASVGTMTVTSYKTDGTFLFSQDLPIAGKGKYVGTVAELGLPDQAAWFKIGSTISLTGFELFGTIDGTQLAAYAGGGGTGARAGVFPKIETDGWTGIAFVNTEAAEASVILTAYSDNGNVVATKLLPPVGGHAKVVNNPEQIFTPQDISTATYIAYTSDRNIVGFQLNGSADGTMLDGLPGM